MNRARYATVDDVRVPLLPPVIRRVLLPLLAAWLAVAAAVAWGPVLTSTGLVGTYFPGHDWKAPAVRTAIEHVGRGDWVEERAPAFDRQPFSVTWRGWIAIGTASTFDLAVESDGHAWVYIGDSEVIDGDQSVVDGARRGRVELAAGLHPFRIDFKSGPSVSLKVLWARAGNPLHDLGQDILFPSRPAYYLSSTWRLGALLATLASLGIVGVVVAAAAQKVARHLEASGASPSDRRWLAAVLALASALLVWQIGFGLPAHWEVDELLAGDVVPGAQQWFAGGWFHLYPTLYLAWLSVFSWPFMAGATIGALDLWSDSTEMLQVVVYRVATAACGLFVVYAAYRCAYEAFGNRRAALWAAFLCAVMPLMVYFGKFAKPDLPYVAAFMASLLYYLRAVRDPSVAHYQAFALLGAIAICLKDQAYGLYVLPAVHLVWLRASAADRPRAGVLGLLTDRALVRAALVTIGTAILSNNLIFNLDGFIAHVDLMARGSGAFRTYDASLAGHAALLVEGLAQIPWMLGWPATLMVAIGLPLAWRTRRDATIALVLPIVSYYVTFITLIGYQYDRFYLAPAVLLAMLAGLTLAWLVGRRTAWATAAAGVVAVYSLAQGVSVNQMMSRDSRFTAEAWLLANVRPGHVVGMAGPRAYLPRTYPLPTTDVQLDWTEIAFAPPEYLVVNLEHARRPRDRAFFAPLLDGTHQDYEPVATFKSPPGLALLAYFDVFRNGQEDPTTNLDKINPEIGVFARRDVIN